MILPLVLLSSSCPWCFWKGTREDAANCYRSRFGISNLQCWRLKMLLLHCHHRRVVGLPKWKRRMAQVPFSCCTVAWNSATHGHVFCCCQTRGLLCMPWRSTWQARPSASLLSSGWLPLRTFGSCSLWPTSPLPGWRSSAGHQGSFCSNVSCSAFKGL